MRMLEHAASYGVFPFRSRAESLHTVTSSLERRVTTTQVLIWRIDIAVPELGLGRQARELSRIDVEWWLEWGEDGKGN